MKATVVNVILIQKKVTKKYARRSNRKKRGLYITKYTAFNVDVVGAFNILRKLQKISKTKT